MDFLIFQFRSSWDIKNICILKIKIKKFMRKLTGQFSCKLLGFLCTISIGLNDLESR